MQPWVLIELFVAAFSGISGVWSLRMRPRRGRTGGYEKMSTFGRRRAPYRLMAVGCLATVVLSTGDILASGSALLAFASLSVVMVTLLGAMVLIAITPEIFGPPR